MSSSLLSHAIGEVADPQQSKALSNTIFKEVSGVIGSKAAESFLYSHLIAEITRTANAITGTCSPCSSTHPIRGIIRAQFFDRAGPRRRRLSSAAENIAQPPAATLLSPSYPSQPRSSSSTQPRGRTPRLDPDILADLDAREERLCFEQARGAFSTHGGSDDSNKRFGC